MSTASTLVKVGVLALAALAAKTAYSAISRDSDEERPQTRPLLPSPGKTGEVFSAQAVQHDLSADDAI